MKYIMALMLLMVVNSCHPQQKKDSVTPVNEKTMTERFDFEIYEKTNSGFDSFTKPDGTIIYMMDFDNENGGVQKEKLPKPSFYSVYKEFYPDGNIKKKETYVGEFVKLGVSEYYDEKGNVTKVNEDNKFGKITPQHALEFLEREGVINLKTGEGRETKDGWPTFELRFNDENGKKSFIITIKEGQPNNPSNIPDIGEPPAYLPLHYEMDGETGKVTKLSEEEN